MARKQVTTEQVKLYMKLRQEDKLTQIGCGAKAGFSERTARTIDHGKHHTQHPHKPRQYKTRESSIDKLWEDELKQKLEDNPALQPTTLFIDLQRNYVDDQGNPIYDASCLRTLQRRVREWKAKHGASKEVMFPQKHYPGDQGLSDFSHMKDIGITIAGKPLDHMIYHFRLVFSKYSYVKVILSGESFQALSEGLQEALFHIGGAPKEHRTDSLAAAYKNDKDVANEDLTDRYKELCAYYGMNPTRNNKGVSHENGSVESSHGHLKNRIKQELMVRGRKDFETLAEYEQWLSHVVENSNRRNTKNFKLEQSALHPLPKHKTADYEVKSVKVSSHSMINIKQIKYSVSARLVGHALTVHISQKDIIAYLGSSEVFRTERRYANKVSSKYVIDYKHLIHAFIKKPRAFRYCQYKDELLPNEHYQTIWQYLDRTQAPDSACKSILRLLKLSADHNCEEALAQACLALIEVDKPIIIESLETQFNKNNPRLPTQTVPSPSINQYDHLLSPSQAGGNYARL